MELRLVRIVGPGGGSRGSIGTQRAQYPLIKEQTFNYGGLKGIYKGLYKGFYEGIKEYIP